MKIFHKKALSVGLVLCLLLSLLALVACSDPVVPEKEVGKIAILYENDVHCAVEGYSKLAAMKKELSASYDHVGVVSSGDFVQGGTLGAVSKGEYIIELMNLVGYDAITLGNHEFDYKIARLSELNALSATKFISCNFVELGEGKTYFEPYTIVSYGEIQIAYIGITTPTTINSASPAQFKDDNGNFIYSFGEAEICETVQANIDAVKAKGADYVVALSHIGYDESGVLSDITDIIENTDGLDVVLDGHSHTVIEEKAVKDKSGDDVLLSSTGTKFEYVGKLTITEEGLDTELIDTETYEKTDAEVDAKLVSIQEGYAELGDRVIGESSVTLNTHDGDVRLVRNSETALGNLCSDALRAVTGADIAYVNGGGLRAPIEVGEISFNDIFSVFPFNNQVVTAEVTGQIILDMLEMGVMSYPNEDGSFPHMSGLTFSINTSIPTSVTVDENGFFTGVNGEYRVYNVQILTADGTYVPLDLDATYVLAGFNYFLIEYGSGMAMFKDAKIIEAEGALDIEVIEAYITQHLSGVIGDEYAQAQGRITITE